ncbi:MAG: extracellular solute-binding protein family 1, partial [Clostridiaceae bacterium]|nr:extracellular solute-binding protein family 1 [Clostridiaceae bacterium]
MKKSRSTVAIFIVTCLILLTGCSKNVQTNKPDELTGSISIAADTSNEQIIKIAAENFKSNNPKVSVNIQPIDTVSLLSSKDEAYKNYDLYITGEENLQKILSLNSKLFYDLGGSITDEKGSIIKNYISNNSYNGKTYGYPWYTYAYVIYYRQDLFKDAGISIEDIKTWQQFIDASAKVNKATGKKILTQESSGRLYSILMNQLRGDFMDKDGKSLISSKVSLKALTVLSSLYSQALLYSSNNIVSEIKNDRVSAILGNSSNMSAVSQGNPNLKDKWKIIQLPAFEPGGNRSVTFGGNSLLLNKDSKNSKLALDF